jgi:hypothetical protein
MSLAATTSTSTKYIQNEMSAGKDIWFFLFYFDLFHVKNNTSCTFRFQGVSEVRTSKMSKTAIGSRLMRT